MAKRYITYLTLMFPAGGGKASIREVSDRLEALGWKAFLGPYDHALEWEGRSGDLAKDMADLDAHMDEVRQILDGCGVTYKFSTYEA